MSAKKTSTNKKSITVIPSKSVPITTEDHPEGVEETEVIAEISIAPEGGWGWVVVLASFLCCFVLDGIFFTFGSIYKDMTNDLGVDSSLVALLNSTAVALYYICGPIISALINRYGFRACAMTGSVILSIAYLLSYFSTNYIELLLCYGILSGFGGCLIFVPSAIIVGFYFERLRSVALSLSGLGSSVGIMIMFNVNTHLVNLVGWRIVTLFHSGLFGTIYFIAMAYRPLVVVTLTTTDTANSSRTVTYLPSMTKHATPISKSKEAIGPSATERMFSAVSNSNYPTASSVLHASQVGPSTRSTAKFTVSVRNLTKNESQKQIVQTMVSGLRVNKDKVHVEVPDEEEQRPKRKGWAKCCPCCEWHEQMQDSRPMYRDDAFYQGKVENLPVYQKSVAAVNPEERTGLEYQMTVTRAATADDLEEHKGVFTTAFRRVLATMMDPQLLRRSSFLLLCCNALLIFVGLLTPYVFLTDRARSEGIDEKHCSLFVSFIGLCTAIGKLLAGLLATKFNPLKMYIASSIISGLGTMAFNFLFDVYYQYFCCFIFGLFTAFVVVLRSLVLVDCYGLEQLTNATGMILMFQGFGSLISSPMSGVLKDMFGYDVPFYVSGAVLILSGIILLPLSKILDKENEALKNNLQGTSKQETKTPKK